jgi:hypothetical protein
MISQRIISRLSKRPQSLRRRTKYSTKLTWNTSIKWNSTATRSPKPVNCCSLTAIILETFLIALVNVLQYIILFLRRGYIDSPNVGDTHGIRRIRLQRRLSHQPHRSPATSNDIRTFTWVYARAPPQETMMNDGGVTILKDGWTTPTDNSTGTGRPSPLSDLAPPHKDLQKLNVKKGQCKNMARRVERGRESVGTV